MKTPIPNVLLALSLGLAASAGAQTPMAVDLEPGPEHSSPFELTAFGDVVFFNAFTTATGFVTFRSDGTPAGTTVFNPPVQAFKLAAIGNTLYYTGNHDAYGSEMWTSDGTTAVLLADIIPGPDGSFPRSPTRVGNLVFFDAFDAALGRALYKTDGTTAGTVFIKQVAPPESNFRFRRMTAAGGLLFFVAEEPVHGRELWRSDGTAAGTFMVADIQPGTLASDPSNLVELDGVLYFTASDAGHGTELWRSDGTTAGTTMVKDIFPGPDHGGPDFVAKVGGVLYFSARDGVHGSELWRSDGTAAGTFLVADIVPGPDDSDPRFLSPAGGRVVFEAFDPVHGRELWSSDGTAAGTMLVADIRPGPGDSQIEPAGDRPEEVPKVMVEANGVVFFRAVDGVTGRELWRSDGTAAGTALVADLNPGPANSDADWMTAAEGRLFFAATEPTIGGELWALDLAPPGNNPPVAADDDYATNEDEDLAADAVTGVLANDFDPDGDPITAVLETAPASGVLALNQDGSFSYAPNADFNGVDAFTYRAEDAGGALSDLATVTITVAGVNDPPVAADDIYAVAKDTTLNVAAPGVLDNDTDIDNPALTAALVTGPANGALVLDPDGSFTYTPVNGFVGTDSFTYRANDGLLSSNTATVDIVIAGFIMAPIAGTNTPIPGGAGFFTGFPEGAGACGSGAVVFLGTGSGGQQGLYAQWVGDSSPIAMADLNTPIPDGSGSFTELRDLRFSALPGDPCRDAAAIGAGPGGQQGVYLFTSCEVGPPSLPALRLADLVTPIPDGAGTFTGMSDLALRAIPGDPCREAAFIGEGMGQLGVYVASACRTGQPEPPLLRIADLDTGIPGGSGSFTALREPSLSFQPGDPCHEAAFVGDGAGGQQGIYAASFGDTSCSGDVVALADLSTSIPGGSGAFTALREPSLSFIPGDPCQEAAFIGEGTGGQQGIYATAFGNEACSGAVTSVADRGTAIPEGQGTFTSFLALSASKGHTAFLATGAGGQKGIYLASTLTKVVDLSDTLEGSPLADLRLGPDGLAGNRLVFVALFADGSEAVFRVTIDFPDVNDAPVSSPDGFAVAEDDTLVVAASGVLANDVDVEGDVLTAAMVSSPAHGALALAADGSFTYTPNADFNGGDSFTYIATDQGGAESNVATVLITIAPVNDAPVAANDSYATTQDTPLIVAAPGVLGNDTDAEGGVLTAVLATDPANGTVSLGADGSFTYTPNPGFAGNDSFTYRASDGQATSGAAVVNIAVQAGSDPIWTPTGSLNVARTAHTATLLPSGKVLVVGGYGPSGLLKSAELYDPATGAWTATGNLQAARTGHTAVLLPNGKVLVTGGLGTFGFLKSAELYNPATGTWSATGSLKNARAGHTAAPLPNGKVLVAGGLGLLGILKGAELYDPATGTWTPTGNLGVARTTHSATVLPDGKVLHAGGLGNAGLLKSAEIYNPSTGTWSAAGNLAVASALHTATRLADGRVLLAGGLGLVGSLGRAERYDPSTGTWTPVGGLAVARSLHTATALPDGRVLVAGGLGANLHSLKSAELFDPASAQWSAAASLGTARDRHTATLLPSGQVLAAGGGVAGLAGAEIFD
jgi:ELWxxDGT repeat protein/VCBS repeat-containing protein